MRPALKLLAIAVLMVASGAIGAGIYAMMDNEAHKAQLTNKLDKIDKKQDELIAQAFEELGHGKAFREI